jgi:predicted dehydrogenase
MLRWGILGTGFISNKMIEAVKASDGSTLHTIAGRQQQALDQFQTAHGFVKQSLGYDDVMADPDVDAVYIGAPNHVHHMLTLAAAAQGKPVLSEKSLTTTMAQANALVDGVTSAKTFFVEGLMYLAHPFLARFVEVLKDGRLGDLKAVNGFYSADIWKVTNPAGRGTLYNLGCYPTSLMHLVVQTMCDEAAFGARRIHGTGNVSEQDGTVVDAAMSVRFDNGVLGTLQSTDSFGMAYGFNVLGTHGVLRFVTNPWLPIAGRNHMQWCPYNGEIEDIFVDDPYDAFYHQLKMVEASIGTKETQAARPSPRLRDSVEIMEFLTEWERQALSL